MNNVTGNLPLAAYGKLVTADATGKIRINITHNNGSNGEMVLAALAIQSISGTYPAANGDDTSAGGGTNPTNTKLSLIHI